MLDLSPGNTLPGTFRNGLVFILALVACTLLLGRVLPPAGDRITAIKTAGLSQHLGDCNLLVLGSSASYHGVNPAVFDAVAAEEGLLTRTYNMAMPGTCLAENYHILERIAGDPPEDLRWILVEAESVMRVRNSGYFLTAKNIAWHDVSTLRLTVPYIAGLELDPLVELKTHWRNGVSLTYNLLGVGRGLPWVESSLGLGVADEELARWLGPARNGFRPVSTDPDQWDLKSRDFFVKNPGHFGHRMRLLVERRVPVGEPSKTALPYFQRISDLAKSMGARVIFYTLHGSYVGRDVIAMAQAGDVDSLLRLDDKRRYPELFDIEYSYDGTHFTEEGADALSRYLAKAFVRDERELRR